MFAKDYRNLAWSKLGGKWTNPVLAALIYFVISASCAAIQNVGFLAALIVSGPLMIGMCIISLKVINDELPEVNNLFHGFKNFKNSFILYATNYLLILAWSLLFIIPGIVKQYSYSMSYYIMVENPDITANEARKQSMIMMQGNRWRLFCLDFSFIGWVLLSCLTLGILFLWVVPYMEVAHASFYKSICTGIYYPLDLEENAE